MMEWGKAVAALNREPVRPVYALVGTEPFLVRRFLRKLADRMEQDGQRPYLERHRFDDEGYMGAIAACQTQSLFSEASLVVLEQVTALTSAKAAGKVDLGPLEDYLDNPVPHRVLVITVEADKLDERKRAVKLLKKHVLVDCHPPKDAEAERLICELAGEMGVVVEDAAIAELWRRCRMLTLCEQELAKLRSFSENGTIDVDAVRELVAEPIEDNVFQWVEGVLRKKVRDSIRVLHEMRIRGAEPLSLLALMAHRLRLLGFVRVLQQRGIPESAMASRLKVHPYALKQAARLAPRVALSEVERLLVIIADAEYAIKSGRQDPDVALEWVVMACLASKPHAVWAR
ncbi:MAG: DNA polymerase III subunit delta [Alicyclobacillus herbarius]|uniref:DNA polymerase III subunit delta n=1 Tax=Alicyclobacillus herbarius TaxID=122960 RepID=UPI0023525433|nr:DNA polymerase III subunit delta [Alicyclobacillus herbarius]MCL6631065.1 DNA polymerase III subunit delta [Alicyclobacillus herbarius]